MRGNDTYSAGRGAREAHRRSPNVFACIRAAAEEGHAPTRQDQLNTSTKKELAVYQSLRRFFSFFLRLFFSFFRRFFSRFASFLRFFSA